MYLPVAQGLLVTLDISAIYMRPLFSCITMSFVSGGVHFDKTSFKFEGKRKDTSLVITRSFQYFFEHRHQL